MRDLITHWMDAERLIGQIRQRNGCGSSGSEIEPTLNAVLDGIIQLTDEDDGHVTHKGRDVIDLVVQLEEAKLRDDRQQIVQWAGMLVQAAATLANDYLGDEAEDIRMEDLGVS